MTRPDQLDVQCEMALRKTRSEFAEARRRVAEWEPRRVRLR